MEFIDSGLFSAFQVAMQHAGAVHVRSLGDKTDKNIEVIFTLDKDTCNNNDHMWILVFKKVHFLISNNISNFY